MTDNEIIKAFEYCPQTRACAHAECPLFGYEETVAECAAELNEKVRDLIKRQQERIEDLEALAMLKNKRHYYNRFIKEAGRLIETKFAIGQTVYDIRYEETYDKAWYYINKSTFTHAHIPAQDRYYATKAEAEQKLEELKGE